MPDDINKDDQNAADTNLTDGATFEEGDVSKDDQSSSTDDSQQASANDANKGDQNLDSDQTDKTGDDDKQDKMTYAFKKKQHQLQEEKLKSKKAEDRATKAEAALKTATAKKRPEVPDYPDTLDPNYDEKLRVRDETIRLQEKFDRDALDASKAVQNEANMGRIQKINEVKDKQTKFVKRTSELGIKEQDAAKYENVITPFITPKNAKTAEFILGHDNGPLIVKHLAENPFEMEKVMSMGSMDAAVYISTELSAKAESSKPKNTKTPAPINTPEGKGAPESKHPALEGATFD